MMSIQVDQNVLIPQISEQETSSEGDRTDDELSRRAASLYKLQSERVGSHSP